MIDIERYVRVLKCLIQNSIDHTKKGTIQIQVKIMNVDMDGSKILVTHIDDTGMGIKKEDASKLFKFFGKVDKDMKQTTLGIGLGLTASKMIVEQMGGRIEFESIYKKGSRFSF